MKRTFAIIAAAMLMLVAVAAVASEDWRGDNRLAGTVVDKNTGAAVKGAKLMLRIQKGSQGGPDITADANGKWAVLGLAAGSWNIDVEAPGYVVRKIGPISFQQGQRLPPVKIELEPQVVSAADTSAPAEAAHEEVKIGGKTVSKDIADAVEAGNALIAEKKYKEAVAKYEIASTALPDSMDLRKALARAYYGAGDVKKAIAAMELVYKADPANAQYALLYANILLEDGQLAEGKKVVEALPAGTLTDPTALINIGILMMNKKQPAAAVDYFTRAIAIAPSAVDGYYYRGLAYLQSGKTKDAKPDLQKTIELGMEQSGEQYIETRCKTEADVSVCRSRLVDTLAPTRNMVTEAKEYLKSIK